MLFGKTGRGTAAAFASVSRKVSDYRGGVAEAVEFDEEDRKAQEDQ
jgi:hypothetical protein